MKTIAVPLLLAGSAQAQTPAEERRARALDGDRAVPAPTLIADAWSQGDCSDTAVTAAASALTSAESAKTTKANDVPALQTALTAAITANTAAVEAVIAAETAAATGMAADDVAERELVRLKKVLDDATFAKTAADLVKTAATTANTAAAGLVTTETATYNTMSTTKDTKTTAETTAISNVSTALTAKNTADSAYQTPNGELAALVLLTTNAKSARDTAQGNLDTATVNKDYQDKLKVKVAAQQTNPSDSDASAAATALTTATAGGSTYATTKATFDTAQNTWRDLARTTVSLVKTYQAAEASDDSAWTALQNTGAATCATTTMEDVAASSLASSTESKANCRDYCKGKLHWVDTNSLPAAATITGSLNNCTGYSYDGSAAGNSKCKVTNASATTAPTAGAAGTPECNARNKSVAAPTLFNAITASNDQQTAYKAYMDTDSSPNAATAAVKAAYEAVYDLTKTKEMADAVKTDIDTYYGLFDGTQAGDYKTAQDTYTPLSSAQPGLNTAYTTALKNETDKKVEIATALAAQNAKTAAWNETVALKNRATVEKDRAIANLAAQGTVKTAAETAASTASGALGTATTAATNAGTAVTNAQTAYDTQLAAAGGITAPTLTTLNTARTTALTKAGELQTALTSLANAETAVATAQATLDAASATHLAAIVACKETKFDAYTAALKTAQATRTSNMRIIEGIVDKAEANREAAGTAGARCEKAASNGTGRPARGETTCGTDLCCGAASGPLRTSGRASAGALVADSAILQSTTTVTIETCQPAGATEYAFRPPRAPMATAEPDTVTWPFACIEGAQKLAAAASALATAAYMLA